MWIVNLALRRPYTFIVLAIFILIAGVLSIISTPKDIFPSINIPVISVIFNYAGMSPKDLEQHLTVRKRGVYCFCAGHEADTQSSEQFQRVQQLFK